MVKFSVLKKFSPRIVSGFEPTSFLLLWIGCIFIHCKHFLQCLSFREHILMALLALIVFVFPSKTTYLNLIIAKQVGPCFYFNFEVSVSCLASSVINSGCRIPCCHPHLCLQATFAPLLSTSKETALKDKSLYFLLTVDLILRTGQSTSVLSVPLTCPMVSFSFSYWFLSWSLDDCKRATSVSWMHIWCSWALP